MAAIILPGVVAFEVVGLYPEQFDQPPSTLHGQSPERFEFFDVTDITKRYLIGADGNFILTMNTSVAMQAAHALAGGTLVGVGTTAERQLGPAIPIGPFKEHDGVGGEILLTINKSTVNTNSKVFNLRVGPTILVSLDANTAWSTGVLEFSIRNQGSTNSPAGWLKFTGDDGAPLKLATFNIADGSVELKNQTKLQVTVTATSTSDCIGIAGRNLRS